MLKLHIDLKASEYPIYISNNSFDDLPTLLSKHKIGKRLLIITDTRVERIYADELLSTIPKGNYNVSLYSFPDGEHSKQNLTVEQIYTWMLENNLKRDVSIIALGGGVVGDLAGFVAATYMRGVRFIQIPTTLLSQVDSSVGGKVGINHQLGKNVIGAFYHPQFVLINPTVLLTLPKREINCGLAEVIKYGLSFNMNLFENLEKYISKFFKLDDWQWIENVIYTCCSIKAGIVEKDEKESGLRRKLNFGHTIGHALESATNYEYFNHGEAVIYGMIAAAHLSYEKHYLSEAELNRALKLISAIDVPSIPREITEDLLLDMIRNDKKQVESGLNYVYLNEIGNSTIDLADESVMRSGINHIMNC